MLFGLALQLTQICAQALTAAHLVKKEPILQQVVSPLLHTSGLILQRVSHHSKLLMTPWLQLPQAAAFALLGLILQQVNGSNRSANFLFCCW
jgi:hypothetical protein